LHLALRIACNRVAHHRDVITEFGAEPDGRLDAGVSDESDHDELVDAVLLELQIQVCVGETA
jgi:hypothetical protein